MNNIRKVYRIYEIEKTHSHFQQVYGLSLTNEEFDTYEDAERWVIESAENNQLDIEKLQTMYLK